LKKFKNIDKLNYLLSANLEIQDGNPWWLSPDIWVVPGVDPSGIPGSPIVGQNNYIWARVHNDKRNTTITGAQVDFFWSNPATGVLRSNSVLVGSSYVDLAPGESKPVLCITPWIPIIVNNGHECIVAQVSHLTDPLPNPLPDPFDPPSYRQIAQRNLTVVNMIKSLLIHIPIQISSSIRINKTSIISLMEEPRVLKEDMLKSIGLANLNEADFTDKLEVGFVENYSCDEQPVQKQIKVETKEGTSRAVYLQIKRNNKSSFGYHLINVIEQVDNKIIGGITFVVISQEGVSK
jgi:hypothetical protein